MSAKMVKSMDQGKAAYLDPILPIDERVDDLVGRMTLEKSPDTHGVRFALGVPTQLVE